MAVRLESAWLPEIGCDPIHPPSAVQEMVLADDQLSVTLSPVVTDTEDAVNESVGAGMVVVGTIAGAGVVTGTGADVTVPPALIVLSNARVWGPTEPTGSRPDAL